MIQPLFIGTTELLLIGGIALLLFGGKKLPEMMKGLGQGVKSFKEGMNGPSTDEVAKTSENTDLTQESEELPKTDIKKELPTK